MSELVDLISLFAYGFITGWLWVPLSTVVKKICSEAKIASREWKEPNR